MPRRSPGSGYVATRPRPDGLWPGGVKLPNGERKRVYGRTQDELREKVAAELQKIAEGRPSPQRDALTTACLTAFVQRRRRTGKGLALSTVINYEGYIRLHVAPYLGHRRVASLTMHDLEWLYDRLREKGLSDSTVHRVHSFLHVALKDAERRGEIGRNPCDLIDAPADTARAPTKLDLADVTAYLTTALGDRDEALWIVAAETGVRSGELLALRIADLDLDGEIVDVPEKVRRVKGRGMVRSRTKTGAGDRAMAIGGWAVASLRTHLDALAVSGRPNPLGLVWPNSRGGYREPQNFYRRTWRPFLRRAGLDETTEFRELTRKVHASVAVLLNIDPMTLKSRMGHTEVSTTLERYAKATPTADKQAARRIDRLYRQLASGKPQPGRMDKRVDRRRTVSE